jgi:hypothetical protein
MPRANGVHRRPRFGPVSRAVGCLAERAVRSRPRNVPEGDERLRRLPRRSECGRSSATRLYDCVMKSPVALLLLAASLTVVSATGQQKASGSLCVAPRGQQPPATAGTPELMCKSGNLSVRIDARSAMAWPKDESSRIDGLSLAGQHRVVVSCDAKPQQSFKFRFSQYKGTELCLFLNDLYQTVQLWEREGAPWCKCT